MRFSVSSVWENKYMIYLDVKSSNKKAEDDYEKKIRSKF